MIEEKEKEENIDNETINEEECGGNCCGCRGCCDIEEDKEEQKEECGEEDFKKQIEEKNSEINNLRKQIETTINSYITLRADFENYKRRNNESINRIIEKTKKDVFIRILDVVDDFERIFEIEKDNFEKIGKKTECICGKMKKILGELGVNEFVVKEGDAFDSNFQDAIDAQETEDENVGKVINVTQNGYMLDGKILRFASVIVGKRKE